MTPRIGLALSGGGARGAFTAGVVRYLAQAKSTHGQAFAAVAEAVLQAAETRPAVLIQ